MEHELLSLSSDSWTDAQQPNPCTPTVIQGFAEHVCLPADDPIEDFSEEDMATGSMAAAGKSPNKHPRTGSEEDSVDIAALLDRAADQAGHGLQAWYSLRGRGVRKTEIREVAVVSHNLQQRGAAESGDAKFAVEQRMGAAVMLLQEVRNWPTRVVWL